MAGIPVAFGDVLHQYGNNHNNLHRRMLAKRQREPINSNPLPSSTDDSSNSLSLGRPSSTPGAGGDDKDTSSSSSSSSTTPSISTPSVSRTRTPISDPASDTTTTPIEDTETTTSETSTSTSETSSSVAVITTTIESTSTSTSFSSTEEETSTEAETTLPTTTLPTTAATTRALITSIVTASATLRSTASNSLASAAASSDNSSSPSAGTVVGIVAGALVGVVVLSGIVGYFFRTKCSNKNDQDDFDGENPFGNMDDGFGGAQTRSELRRDSQLLADDSDSIHQMSELGHGGYGNAAPVAMGMGMGAGAAAGAYALNRGNSTNNNNSDLPGLQRNDTMNPRPPTMIQRHYAAQQQGVPPMPSFQPGQIVYPAAAGQHNQSGPYPTFAGAGVPVGGVFPSSSSSNGHHDLNRNPTYREQQQYPSNADYGYQQDGVGEYEQQQPQRTGTPEHANPQQYFHQATDSFSSGIGNPSPFDDGNASPARNPLQSHYTQQQQGNFGNNGYNNNGYDQGFEQLQPSNLGPAGAYNTSSREGAMKGSERAKRTLSVRNGGAIDGDEPPRDSVYGGM